ncbi:hypothetical protein GGR16_002380 [Chelatococcus caeni]|uniref:Uncharacterized protein n=1 Tax=Chelatococcus caeni TaxID=1348468 RepID=A0A840BV71_9HYPH|nr:hypothetical protein [Chelatococcus caeni]MBB4017351.1 hypothetical protein [Chelatococcus caeni]
MPKAKHIAPNEIIHTPDVFASGVDVHDWEDWIRMTFWADARPGIDDGDAKHERRVVAHVVIPRSSLPNLMRSLRQSAGHREEPRRHS